MWFVYFRLDFLYVYVSVSQNANRDKLHCKRFILPIAKRQNNRGKKHFNSIQFHFRIGYFNQAKSKRKGIGNSNSGGSRAEEKATCMCVRVSYGVCCELFVLELDFNWERVTNKHPAPPSQHSTAQLDLLCAFPSIWVCVITYLWSLRIYVLRTERFRFRQANIHTHWSGRKEFSVKIHTLGQMNELFHIVQVEHEHELT